MKKTLFAVVGLVLFGAMSQVVFAQSYIAPTYPTYNAGCPTLSYNLYRGLSDYYTQGQVTQLQQFLNTRYNNQLVTGYFGAMTAANVARFQQEQGVYPVTGGVGPLTRAAIARVCGGIVIPPTPSSGVSITNVSGPNALTVGQTGTWNITTSAPVGSYLSMSVRWGDENQYGYATPAAQASYVSSQNTFSHSYAQAGTYTITFTVTDQFGRTNSASASVQVSGNTSVSGFTATPTSGTAPLAVAFSINTVTGNDISSLYIDFGDGQTAKPQTIYCFAAPCIPAMTSSHTYTAAGTYTAKLLRDNNYCAPGMYCTLQYREPTLLGTVVITVSGSTTTQSVSAYPTYGPAPLTVTFSPGTYTGQYAVDFGDNTSASQVVGSITHTYWGRGTYTAQFQSDPACRHQQPFCAIATINLGSVGITVY